MQSFEDEHEDTKSLPEITLSPVKKSSSSKRKRSHSSEDEKKKPVKAGKKGDTDMFDSDFDTVRRKPIS